MLKGFLVLKLLCDGNLHNINEISETLEISKATIKRCISILRDTGVEIETKKGKNGGYRMKVVVDLW